MNFLSTIHWMKERSERLRIALTEVYREMKDKREKGKSGGYKVCSREPTRGC